MEFSSQETKTSGQANRGTSLSALIDAIALQEQCFEQSLASQQLWSQQLADTQEAKIKAAVQKTTVGAAEVDEILKGKNIVALEVKTEEFNSERGSKEWEPQLQPPSQQFSRSKSRSTSLFRYREVNQEHRRYSPGDHVSKRDLGNFNSNTRYDHYEDDRRSSHGENVCPSGDRRLHAYRRSLSIERRWKPERRSPSESKPQRYCHEDSLSPRFESFRCQLGDSRGRNYPRVCRSPVDDSNPHHGRSIDSRKQRERRDASPLKRSRKRERSPYKSKPQTYHDEDSDSPRSGSFGCQSSDRRGRNYCRVYRSPAGDSIPHNRRSIDSGKHRERRGASPLAIGRSHKNRNHLAEDLSNGHADYYAEKISEPTGTRSGCWSKQTMHVDSQKYSTSETLNAKAPCLASVCVNNFQDHLDTKQLQTDPTELTRYPSPECRSKQQLEPQGRMKLGRKHHRRYEEEESEKDGCCVDAKLEARENKKKMKGHLC